MPYKRKSYAKKKRPFTKAKKVYRKKSRYRGARVSIVPRLGFPQRVTTNVLWTTEPLSFVSYGPTPDFAWFSLNSINRCQIGGVPPTANQPLWTDQYRTLYEHYRVNSCTVSMIATSYSSGSNVTVFMIPTSSGTAVNHNFKNYVERGYPSINVSTASKATAKMKRKYIPSIVEAIKPIQYKTDPLYSAGVNSDPILEPFLTISSISSDNVSTVQCYITLSFKYNVTFYDLKPIGPS